MAKYIIFFYYLWYFTSYSAYYIINCGGILCLKKFLIKTAKKIQTKFTLMK